MMWSGQHPNLGCFRKLENYIDLVEPVTGEPGLVHIGNEPVVDELAARRGRRPGKPNG